MASVIRDIVDLIRWLVVLIIVIYMLSAILAVIEIGKAISQFLSSIGYGAIIVGVLIVLFVLLREEF
jgi:hypothetical protein